MLIYVHYFFTGRVTNCLDEFVLKPPQGVLVPPVQHGMHNANAPPSQGAVPPSNEIPNPQAPPPNNFPPQSNVYRGQPQPVNPQRTYFKSI